MMWIYASTHNYLFTETHDAPPDQEQLPIHNLSLSLQECSDYEMFYGHKKKLHGPEQ